MQSTHTLRKLKIRRAEMNECYWHNERTIAGNREVRFMRRRYFRADRHLTRIDLKMLCRGNLLQEEQEELERLELLDWIEEFEYVEGPHYNWIEWEDCQEFADSMPDEFFDEDWENDPDHGCFDEDDNLIRGWH
jgi:hypothetical protein